jgi:hypothetical protein
LLDEGQPGVAPDVSYASGGNAMWIVLSHLSGSILGVTTVIAVVVGSAGTVFRYPYMWRYLEARMRARHSQESVQQQRAETALNEVDHVSSGKLAELGDRPSVIVVCLDGKDEVKADA